MTEETKLFDKELSLAELDAEVSAYEVLGPLKALGRSEEKTGATYTHGAPPDNPVVLRPGSQVDEGYEKVCEGTVWITSQPQKVVAIRMKAA